MLGAEYNSYKGHLLYAPVSPRIVLINHELSQLLPRFRQQAFQTAQRLVLGRSSGQCRLLTLPRMWPAPSYSHLAVFAVVGGEKCSEEERCNQYFFC